jgi:putative tryptophan/tyrosine transport system substrate-binding protein
MRPIGLAVALALSLSLAPLAAEAQEAQQSAKVRKIGWLSGVVPPTPPFLHGLRELGWIERQNLIIERRSAEGNLERLPDLAAELVRLRVEIIVAGDSAAIDPARQATKTLPIVMTVSGDPVGAGFVVSLGRPGGNITGLTNVSPELAGKRLELLKEFVPRLGRVAVLGEPRHPDWQTLAAATAALGVQLQPLKVSSRDEFEDAFHLAASQGAGGLIVLPSPLTNLSRTRLVALAKSSRLPAVYALREYVEAGGLIAYGPNIPAMYHRAATYVDKILKGVKPADLPIEQPTKFELVINLKTAKALGLTIPQTLLLRADQVIE